jgi:beta-glucanase (GH16 family)
MTERLLNNWRGIKLWLILKLGITPKDKTVNNFELVKEWDFTKMDIPTLSKDFRFQPPWGEKININHTCRFDVNNIRMTSEGIEFWNSKNDSQDTPYNTGGIISRNPSSIPAFGRIEAEVYIPRYEGQFPAFWTTDINAAMPEFDIFEFMWNTGGKPRFAGNIHYGTSYKSTKWKFDLTSEYHVPKNIFDQKMKFVCEFYPHQTVYYLNNVPVWKSVRGYTPNNKLVWLNGGTFYKGPEGNGPWLSMKVTYLKFYKLKENE